MSQQLNHPCAKCPFRTDILAYLTVVRAEEIADSLRSGAEFPCHSTLDYNTDEDDPALTDKTSFCAGAMIVLERSEGPNQMMLILERLGMYDHQQLHIHDAPVFLDLEEFIDAQEER